MKIGILGGTFNPPHLGHLVLGYTAYEKLSLDKVLFVPTNIPPHKKCEVIESEHRLNMLKLALAPYSNLEVCDIEIKRGGISYTVDTVRAIALDYPDSELFLVIGADLQRTLPTWKDWPILEDMVRVVVANRDKLIPNTRSNAIFIDMPAIDASSSKLREEIKFKTFNGQLIPQAVYEYIVESKLY